MPQSTPLKNPQHGSCKAALLLIDFISEWNIPQRDTMLRQVEAWSTINSGSRNLDGLEAMIGELAGAFSDLPGELRFEEASPVEAIDTAGKAYQVAHGRNLHLTVRPTLGLGWLKAVSSVAGFTDVAAPGQAARRVPGGLLAQPSNGGTFHTQRFAWMPALELTTGYQVNDHVLVHVGWSGQYFRNVLRAGDQIDPVVTATQFTGRRATREARPRQHFDFTDLWVTGFNVGCEVRY